MKLINKNLMGMTNAEYEIMRKEKLRKLRIQKLVNLKWIKQN